MPVTPFRSLKIRAAAHEKAAATFADTDKRVWVSSSEDDKTLRANHSKMFVSEEPLFFEAYYNPFLTWILAFLAPWLPINQDVSASWDALSQAFIRVPGNISQSEAIPVTWSKIATNQWLIHIFPGVFFVFVPEPKTSKISADHLETARVWHRIPDGWGTWQPMFVGLQFLHVNIAVYKEEPSDVHTYLWSKQR